MGVEGVRGAGSGEGLREMGAEDVGRVGVGMSLGEGVQRSG